MKTAKNHWDAIAGLLGNRKRRLSKDERRALEYANAIIASQIVAEMPSEPNASTVYLAPTAGEPRPPKE